MSKAHGQIRRGQVITTYGPGALIDLPRDSAIVAGLEFWPRISDLDEISEPRLSHKLQALTGIPDPRLYAPPPETNDPREKPKGITAWRFPEWFVVQDEERDEDKGSRRLVHRKDLDERFRFDGRPVVATRFVRACPKGHVDDIDWYQYVHGTEDNCRRRLRLVEKGTSGDLADLIVRCECGKERPLYEATKIEETSLGFCRGRRPWLGTGANEECKQPSRLLIRTASNAYFPQVMSVLSLPDHRSDLDAEVEALWDDLQIVDSLPILEALKRKPRVSERLALYSDERVLEAIQRRKSGAGTERPVKHVELDAILSSPEGFEEDIPVNPNWHARKLPDHIWRHSDRWLQIEAVYQLHRLREVLALIGFTRLEAVMPDINGEYETDVERAEIAREPRWFPAVENRGEGIFIQISSDALDRWSGKEGVQSRLRGLHDGHKKWAEDRKSDRPFPGGKYLVLHTLSHLLIQSLAMRCGYPASSIRERIYSDMERDRYGILLFTGSPDAEGTLGGLVQQARHIEEHLAQALRASTLCSNDPICAQHIPGESIEGRWLHGAACHGCALIAETSCEMRNDYLDRALVVPTLGDKDAAFFQPPS